jgi:hypothetical protein
MATLTHFAVSMHIYDEHVTVSKEVIKEYKASKETRSVSIPSIPENSKPLEQIAKLIKLEVEIRHHSQGLTGNNIEEWIARGQSELNSYWQQFYFLLLLYVVTQKSLHLKTNLAQREIALTALQSVLDEPWKSYLPETTFDVGGTKVNSIEELVPLEIPGTAGGAQIIMFHEAVAHKRLQEQVAKFETEKNTRVTWNEFVSLESQFADRIAARDGKPFKFEEIEKALTDLRNNDKN